MLQEHRFDAGDVTINYAEGPDAGPALLLLHGGSSRWQHFDVLYPNLVARWHVYAPDLRGHGHSGRAPMGYRVRDYACDIVALLRERIAEPAILFGHSLGGIVALMVAAQAPENVRALIVGDSPLTAETWRAALAPGRDRLIAWRDLSGGAVSLEEIVAALKDAPLELPGRAEPAPMREVFGEDAPYFPWMAENLYRQDPDMLTMLLDHFDEAAAGYEMDALLPKIGCPVLLLQADPAAGAALSDAEVARAMRLLARPTHVRLAGMSHVLHNERKQPVLEAIDAFLTTI